MSVHQMGLVWGLDLPESVKFTLLALADHADHDGRHAHPGAGLLAWKTGKHPRTVKRHLRTLEGHGLIVPMDLRGGRGHATEYDLHLEKGAKLSPFRPPPAVDKAVDKAAPETGKGDTPGLKGDTAMSPQRPNHHEERRAALVDQSVDNSLSDPSVDQPDTEPSSSDAPPFLYNEDLELTSVRVTKSIDTPTRALRARFTESGIDTWDPPMVDLGIAVGEDGFAQHAYRRPVLSDYRALRDQVTKVHLRPSNNADPSDVVHLEEIGELWLPCDPEHPDAVPYWQVHGS